MVLKHSSIALLLALAAFLPTFTAEATARSSFKLLPKTSLWAQIPQDADKDAIKALCDEMIARQDASPIGMMDASSLYTHGKVMGVSCVKVDYYKALVLAKRSGDAFTLKVTLTYIGSKAGAGVGSAQRALEKFEKNR